MTDPVLTPQQIASSMFTPAFTAAVGAPTVNSSGQFTGANKHFYIAMQNSSVFQNLAQLSMSGSTPGATHSSIKSKIIVDLAKPGQGTFFEPNKTGGGGTAYIDRNELLNFASMDHMGQKRFFGRVVHEVDHGARLSQFQPNIFSSSPASYRNQKMFNEASTYFAQYMAGYEVQIGTSSFGPSKTVVGDSPQMNAAWDKLDDIVRKYKVGSNPPDWEAIMPEAIIELYNNHVGKWNPSTHPGLTYDEYMYFQSTFNQMDISFSEIDPKSLIGYAPNPSLVKYVSGHPTTPPNINFSINGYNWTVNGTYKTTDGLEITISGSNTDSPASGITPNIPEYSLVARAPSTQVGIPATVIFSYSVKNTVETSRTVGEGANAKTYKTRREIVAEGIVTIVAEDAFIIAKPGAVVTVIGGGNYVQKDPDGVDSAGNILETKVIVDESADNYAPGAIKVKGLKIEGPHHVNANAPTEGQEDPFAYIIENWQRLRSNEAYGEIGARFGSAIANALPISDPFVRVATSALLSTIGENLAEIVQARGFTVPITPSVEGGPTKFNVLSDMGEEFGQNLAEAAGSAITGAISSYLVAEIIDGLGLEGTVVGDLGGSIASAALGQIITNVAKIAAGAKDVQVLDGVGDINVGNIFASYLGGRLADAIWSPTSTYGQIGAAIGSAVGTVIIGLESFNSLLTGIGIAGGVGGPVGILIAALVVAISQLIGGLIGSLFGASKSYADITLKPNGVFAYNNVRESNAGSLGAAHSVANATVRVLNAVVKTSGATLVGDFEFSNTVGMRNDKFVDWKTGYRSKDPTDVTNRVIFSGLATVVGHLGGGNVFIKRALMAHVAGNTAESFEAETLSGDLSVAVDYARYRTDLETINAAIAIDPHSAFALGWVATLARAGELGLDRRAMTDWIGGWNLFLDQQLDGKIDGSAVIPTYVDHYYNTALERQIDMFADGWRGEYSDTVFGSQKSWILATAQADVIDLRSNVIADPIGLTIDGEDSFSTATPTLDNLVDATGAVDTFDTGGHASIGDTVRYAASAQGVSINLSTGAASGGDAQGDIFVAVEGTSTVENLIGSQQADSLTGDARANRLSGLGGADALDGLDGDDILKGGDGDDTIHGGDGQDAASGGAGADAVHGDAGSDQLFGEAGDDHLYGGEGSDVLSGGAGSDILEGGAGADSYIFDGEGDDIIIDNTDPNRIYLAAALRANVQFSRVGDNLKINITGKSGSLTLVGFYAGQIDPETKIVVDGHVLTLSEVQPQLAALGASGVTLPEALDFIVSTPGWEKSQALGALVKADSVGAYKLGAAAVVDGGEGNDIIRAGDLGNDVFGNTGDDTLIGGKLDDWLWGEAGNDVLFAGDVANPTFASTDQAAESAALSADAGNGDLLDGGAGDDRLYGGKGSDWLKGGEGVDRLVGGAGGDILDGGAGNEQGANGAPTVFGGSGSDQYIFGYGYGEDVIFDESNAAGTPGSASDSLHLRWLDAGATTDDWAGYGDSYMEDGSVKGGEDAVVFGPGVTMADLRISRSGQDLVIELTAFNAASNQIEATGDKLTIKDWFETTRRVEWFRFTNGDQVRFGDVVSFSVGTALNNTIVGTCGGDFMYGGDGDDVLYGLQGNDFGFGGRGSDNVFGDQDRDFVGGGAGDDVVNGGGENDTVFGDDGDDIISGDSGNDLLAGGLGNDHIVTGAGNDTVRFSRGDGFDTVIDEIGGVSVDVQIDGILQAGYVRDINGVVTKDGVTYFDGQKWINGHYSWDEPNKTLSRRNAGPVNAGEDTLEFGVGIEIQDLVLRRVGGDLQVAIGMESGSTAFDAITDRITFRDWFGAGGAFEYFSFAGVGRISGYSIEGAGTDGADTINTAAVELSTGISKNDWITSGNGDDVITTGNYQDIVVAGAGADKVSAGADIDTVYGGEGNDNLDGGGSGDRLFGGEGYDFTSYASSTAGVTVYLDHAEFSTGDALNDVWDSIEGIEGSAYADQLGGSADADTLKGALGDDVLLGGAGDDTYEYNIGDGYDSIKEGVLSVTAPTAYTLGADDGGVDTLVMGAGINFAKLGFVRSGNDLRITVNSANAVLLVDQANAAHAVEYMQLADGLTIDLTRLKLAGEAATVDEDFLFGSSAVNTLSGLAGNDVIAGLGGNDTLSGGDGDDVLDGGGNADVLDGGSDSQTEGLKATTGQWGDTIRYVSSTGSVTIDLAAGTASGGEAAGDTIVMVNGVSTIENVVGSDVTNDFLYGDGRANRLSGLTGNDALSGQGGDDVLSGGLGNDNLNGGAGDDAISGDDGNDTVYGGAGKDTLLGGAGIDVLRGEDDDDVILGGNDNDTLWGGAGADLLLGEKGADALNGEAGDDTYVFDAFSGADIITDAAGVNKIVINEVSLDQLWITRLGTTDLLIRVLGGDTAITVSRYYSTTNTTLIKEVMVGGKHINLAHAEALIQAMSAYATPPATMPASIAAQLETFWLDADYEGPTVLPQDYSINEDVVLTGAVNALDQNGDITGYEISREAELGTVVLDALTGGWTYTPTANANGADSFEVTVTDATGATAVQTITINIAPVNDAPNALTTEGPLSVRAGATSGWVAVLKGVDPDGSSGLTYTLSSNPAGRFTLTPDGVLTITEGVAMPTSGTLQIGVKITDSATASTTKQLSIQITPSADTPSAPTIDSPPAVFAEGAVGGQTVATFTLHDPNGPAPSLVLQDDPTGWLEVSGSSLVFKAGVTLDYKALLASGLTPYSVNQNGRGEIRFTAWVRAADGAQSSMLTPVHFKVLDVNTAPDALSEKAPLLVSRTAAANTIVGRIAGVDPDGDTLTFALVDNPGGLFSIDSATGELKVGAAALALPAGSAARVVTVRATDTGGLYYEQDVEIGVTASDLAPSGIAASGMTVVENAAAGTVVGSFTATDTDAGDTVRYSLVDNAGGRFSISSLGVLTASGTGLDFESSATHNVTVRATDKAGLFVDATFPVTVTGVNEAPTALRSSDVIFVNEGSVNNTLLTTFTRLDPDASDTVTYSLLNTHGNRFKINTSTGKLYSSTVATDYEQTQSYLITVKVTDALGLFYTQSFTVIVKDLNEAPALPTMISGSLNLAENSAVGTEVGVFRATDPDIGQTLTYSLTNTAQGRFTINAQTGVVSVASGPTLDYEGATSHTITVQASDGDKISSQNFTVTLLNLNEAPTLQGRPANAPTPMFSEGALTGQTVETLTMGDPDNTTPTLQIVSDPLSLLEVSGSTIRFKTGVNYEALVASGLVASDSDGDQAGEVLYTATVQASDGTATSAPVSLTFRIEDVNEAPTAITATGLATTIDERDRPAQGATSPAITLATLGGVDPDSAATPFGTLAYTVSDSRFEIVSGNQLRLKAGVALDYEAATSQSVVVTATDGGGLSTTRTFTFTVIDKDDYLYGGPSPETLTGQAGKDIIAAGDGGDVVNAGNGADTVYGDGGNDVLSGQGGDDLLEGGIGLDTMAGGDGDDRLVGGDGDDVMAGGLGADRFLGGSGVDTVTYAGASSGVQVNVGGASTGGEGQGDIFEDTPEIVIGSYFGDTIVGTVGVDHIFGHGGDDHLYGGAGADNLYGGEGNDTLDALAGNDNLFGGTGNDTLIGGVDNDTYHMDANSGSDTIVNFDPNGVDIDVIGYDNVTRERLWFAQSGNDLIVSVIGGDTVTTIQNWYLSTSASDRSNYKVDFFIAGDRYSSTINAEGLVQLMAGYTKPTTIGQFDALHANSAFESLWSNYWEGNAPPIVTSVANQTINEDGNLAVQIRVTDDITPVNGVTVTVTAVNPGDYSQLDTTLVNTPQIGLPNANGDRIITVTPKEHRSGVTAIKVVATDPGGLTTQRIFLLTVTAVADQPTLTLVEALGTTLDSGALALKLSSQLSDQDGSETLAIRIENLPAGLTLNKGVNLGGGVWSLTPSDLTGLAILGPSNWAQDLNLTIKATATETATGATAVRTLDLAIPINARPGAITASGSFTVTENVTGSTLGSFSATDPDGTALTYTLGVNPGNLFEISSAGVLKLKSGASLDAEGGPYTVAVVASDGSLTSTLQQTIIVTGVNEQPTNIEVVSGALWVSEGAAAGSNVVRFAGIDPEGTSGLTYSLVDTAGDRFTINSATGQVTVANASLLDYEGTALHQYEITVRVSDGTFSYSKPFNIVVGNVNEGLAPIVANVTGDITVLENSAANTQIVTFVSSDPEGVAVSYSLPNQDSGPFTIDPSTGVLKVKAGASLNYEGTNVYSVVVRATAGSDQREQTFQVKVGNVNEAPNALEAVGSLTVFEGADYGIPVGWVAAQDPDGAVPLYYTLSDNAGRFAINYTSGQIYVLNGLSLIDYETAVDHKYQITVDVRDTANNLIQRTFDVEVTDQPEYPTGVALTGGSLSVAENTAAGPVLATFSGSDPDAGTLFTYSLANDGGGRFSINNAGQLTLVNGAVLDYEALTATSGVIAIQVRATDQTSRSVVSNFNVTVQNINEAPTDLEPHYISGNTFNVLDDADLNTALGYFTRTDPDNDTPVYSLPISSNDRFAIDPNTGQLRVASSLAGAAGEHDITVRVTSGSYSYDEQFKVYVGVSNVAPNAPAHSPGWAIISENTSLAGSTAAIFTLTDPNPNSSLTLHIDTDTYGWFTVSGNQLVLKSGLSSDYEDYGAGYTRVDRDGDFLQEIVIPVVVKAYDGLLYSGTFLFNLSLEDINEAPTGITSAGLSVNENAAAGATVGQVFQIDDDLAPADSWKFTLLNNAGDRFAINENTGVITVANGGSTLLNYETSPSHSILVQVTDRGGTGYSFQQSFTVNLNNVTAAPVFTNGGQTFTLPETTPTSGDVTVWTAALSDPEAVAGSGTLTYSLSGTDAGMFQLDHNTGVLTLWGSLDYETHPGTYYATVTATNSAGSASTTIGVVPEDRNEAPAFLNPAGSWDYRAVDPEGGTVTYTITSVTCDYFYYCQYVGTDPGDAGQSLYYWQIYTPTVDLFVLRPDGSITIDPSRNDWWVWAAESDAVVTVQASDGNSSNSRTFLASVGAGPGGLRVNPPVLLDLDGDGVELANWAQSNVKFDMSSTGRAVQTGWTTGDDAFLAMDRNGDGLITDGSEISFTQDKPGAFSDLEGLQAYDTDGNGKLDAEDGRFEDFLVWRDANSDGVSQDEELATLGQLGITEISLGSELTGQTPEGATGNVIYATSSFTRADGTTGQVGDVFLAYLDPSGRTRTSPFNGHPQPDPGEVAVDREDPAATDQTAGASTPANPTAPSNPSPSEDSSIRTADSISAEERARRAAQAERTIDQRSNRSDRDLGLAPAAWALDGLDGSSAPATADVGEGGFSSVGEALQAFMNGASAPRDFDPASNFQAPTALDDQLALASQMRFRMVEAMASFAPADYSAMSLQDRDIGDPAATALLTTLPDYRIVTHGR